MYNNEDVIVLSSSDEETPPIPNNGKQPNMLIVPGQSSSRYPVGHWQPEDQGYNMQLFYEDSDVTDRDQQNDWSIAASRVLNRAHHADSAENSVISESEPLDLRRKFVDKQKQIKIKVVDIDVLTDNSRRDLEVTQTINAPQEADSQIYDISTASELDNENSESQYVDVVGIGSSSYSENESTFDYRVGRGWYAQNNSENTNKEIDEVILLSSSDEEVNIMY